MPDSGSQPPRVWRTKQASTHANPAPANPPLTLLPTPTSSEYDAAKARIHTHLVDTMNMSAITQLPVDQRRTDLRGTVRRAVESDPLAPVGDHSRLTEELLDDLLGLGPLEPLLRDPSVSDILVNGPFKVYVERKGRLELTSVRFRDSSHVMQILDRIVSHVGRRVDETSPMVDARLQDGSRVNAVIAPLALRGPSISIRRFGTKPLMMEDLLHFRALTPEMAHFLEAAVKSRLNAVISGGTGSGKTTLLNSLSRYIPDYERIVTIEDAAELQLQQEHVVPLETRPPNIEGKGQVTTRDMVRNCLRMRPDRIIVGECRGGEAFDMLQAMNTGHDGSLTTLHANSPRDTISRLETMMLMAGYDLPMKAMRQQIASAIQLLVQSNRLQGGVRRITSITEVVGLEGDTVVLQDIFTYHQIGTLPDGKAHGQFKATGVRPKCMSRLASRDVHFPMDFFAERILMSDSDL
ncbi:MAG: pilus assembly protein CpaF [Planctomycetaceae bacterium]|nr:pilus assembly protein CpaF [Planctomycetaceae bacterium]